VTVAAFAGIQAMSVALTVAAIVLAPRYAWLYFTVFSLGLSHYLVSLLYSGRQLRNAISTPGAAAALGVVLLLGVMAYEQGLPLWIYFGLHHVFNEVYLRARIDPLSERVQGGPLRAAALLLHGLIYVLLLFAGRLESHAAALMLGALVGAVILYGVLLRQAWPHLNPAQKGSHLFLEGVGLALVPVAFVYVIRLEYIVLYHFVFWALFPLHKLASTRGAGSAFVYAGLTMATFLGFYTLSPLGGWPSIQLPFGMFQEQFFLWSYVHITLAFATSSAHPDWITRWFRASDAAPDGVRTGSR